MKKFLIILAAIALIPVSVQAAAVATEVSANSSTEKSIDLEHAVAVINNFGISVLATDIKSAGETTIAEIAIENNTKDGYLLTVNSDGKLSSASTSNGESDIPFGLEIAKAGVIGTGTDETLSFSSSALDGTDKSIIKVADEDNGVSQATDCDLTVKLKVNTQYANAMSLAGTYTSSVTFKYQDK